MLNIYFGENDNVVYNTSIYFDNTYLDSWLEDDFARKIIKDVDKAEVLSPQLINSKALGGIPVKQLSGGTKTLLLVYNNHEKLFNASTCGDNCAKWFLKIADKCKEDITINLYHLMNFGDKNFEIRIVNTGDIVRNMSELVPIAGTLL